MTFTALTYTGADPWDWRAAPPRVVQQTRCVACKRDHDPVVVARISHGLAACSFCGCVPPVFTSRLAYRTQLLAPARPG